jgi:uncharacterized protein with von Willebrand factor type A (vWA) domain
VRSLLPEENVPQPAMSAGTLHRMAGVTIAVVVDRSLIVPDHIWPLFDLRKRLVEELCAQVGAELRMLIAYSEVARAVTVQEAIEPGPDYVYGSNLQAALTLARSADGADCTTHVIVLTYSVPNAHDIDGQTFFMDPPTPQSLEAGREEFRTYASNGVPITVLLLAPDANGDRELALTSFFRPLTGESGGSIHVVHPGDHVEFVVEEILRPLG